MAIPITANSSSNLSGMSDAAATKTAAAKGPEKAGEAASMRADAKTQLNAAIVQSSVELSISSGNKSLELLFRSAVTAINDVLAPELGPNAIQNAMGQDNSAEATAGRIVSLSTGMFELFKQQHPGEEESAVLANFMSTIRGGFEKGFAEATDILKSLEVFNGDIAAGVNKTYELVQKGYADFEASFGYQDQGGTKAATS